MPLICYVVRKEGRVPYLEVLPDLPPGEAARRAAELLADRPDGVRAELWDGDRLIAAIEPEKTP